MHYILSTYVLCPIFLDIPTYPEIEHPLWTFPKANEQKKKKTLCQIFHQKKIQKVLMKIEEMAGVLFYLANFAPHVFLTIAPPSGYALNQKNWSMCQKLAEHLSFHMKHLGFHLKEDLKTNFISPKKHLLIACIF